MRLNFRQYGDGQPVIILHGLFGSLENWAYISQRLAEHFRVYSLDLRNHGGSPHDSVMNYDVMAADVREFLDDREIREAVVLGHSMGGKTAMKLSLLNPERVRLLMVVDIGPQRYAPKHDAIFTALMGLNLSAFTNRAEIEAALEPSIPDPAVRRFLLKGLARDADGTFRWRFNLPVLHRNYSDLNGPIESKVANDRPSLFIRGELSDYIHESDRAGIVRLFPRAEILSIASAGHWLHAEAPEPFLSAVHRALDTM